MGKGSGRRPVKVDENTMTSNWDRIFNKKVNNSKETDDGKTNSNDRRCTP